MSHAEGTSHHPIIRDIISLKQGARLLLRSMAAEGQFFLLDEKETKNQDRISLFDQTSNNLNDFELTTFKHKIILNDSSSVCLRSRNARSLFSASADFLAEASNVFVSSDGNISHQMGASAVGEALNASDFDTIETKPVLMSNEDRVVRQIALDKDKSFGYLGLLQVPCPRGIAREKVSALGKEKEGGVLLDPFVFGMTKKERLVLSSNRSSRHYAPHDDGRKGENMFYRSRSANSQTSKFALLLIFIYCLFNNAALAQPDKDSVAAGGGGEIKPFHTGDMIPEALWKMPLQVPNDSSSKRNLLFLNQAVQSRYRPELHSRVEAAHPNIDLNRFPIIGYKIDTTKIGYIQEGELIPDIILDMPLKIINDDKCKTVNTLRELSNKQFLVLDFWAAWCKPCLESMVKWEALQAEISDDIRVIGVHLDFDYRAVLEVQKRNWTLAQIIGEEGHILNYYLLSKSYLGPSAWIKDGRLFGVSKAGVKSNDYIFDLIHHRIDKLPSDVQFLFTQGR